MKNKPKRILALLTASAAMLLNTAYMPEQTVFAGQQLGQTDFEQGVGLPWHVCESAPGEMEFDISGGVYKITIVNPGGASKGGEDRWDCQFRHRGLSINSGDTYKVSFDITASSNCTYYTKIGDMSEPFTEDWHGEADPSQHESTWDVKPLTANQTQHVEGSFTANRTAEVEWAFHIGGDSVPAGTVFTFDNMSLIDTTSDANDYKAAEEWVRSDILTNQLGYFSDMKKQATLLSGESSGVNFELIDSSGSSVFSGTSVPKGLDPDSGDNVHIIDFSDFSVEGTYHLEAGGAKSRDFTIGGGELYSYMLYDSLNYFYQNRSGIPIDASYIISGDGNALKRAAGHAPDKATIEQTWGYSGSSGEQDVTGGWYDAGDHGKYVVNGGISLWTMQNQYEMALKNGYEDVYGDGTMNIPESGNDFPDLLDEARYEMEWMFKMMVREGEYMNMVYHKVHDNKWTALALAPADDTMERIIKPPTTAATLNMAACAAQASRLWAEIDPQFSKQCITNAKGAYEAAKAHPNMYAPIPNEPGGGPYGDDDATDEFYWAACELYITTGDNTYLQDMKSFEKHYLKLDTHLNGGEDRGSAGVFNWAHTAALGDMSMALNSEKLSEDMLVKLTEAFSEAAGYYKSVSENQGYGQPYEQSTINYEMSEKGYCWGSNSFVMNNSMIMAYAYELTKDDEYLGCAVSGMDYILGRNPMDYSYVTGYGTHAIQNPHHRWWSHQADEKFPSAPNGVVCGGPNSGMQDPWVKGSGWKFGTIAPAKCYMDNIEAWSVNECTINWNAPLAWLSAYLAAQQGSGIIPTMGSADGDANIMGEAPASNNTPGSYTPGEYQGSSSDGDASDGSEKVSGSGGWGLVPLYAGLAGGVILIELLILFVKKKPKKK